MFGRFDRLSSTCLTPPSGSRWRRNLSLAGVIVMAAATALPAAARPVIQGNHVGAESECPSDEPPLAGSRLLGDGESQDRDSALPWDPDGDFLLRLAQSGPPPPPGGGTVIDGGEGGITIIPFPRPTDDGSPDDGVPPQAGKPSLTSPDLLVTKPRVAPDLEGRFSNGGNEEIW